MAPNYYQTRIALGQVSARTYASPYTMLDIPMQVRWEPATPRGLPREHTRMAPGA